MAFSGAVEDVLKRRKANGDFLRQQLGLDEHRVDIPAATVATLKAGSSGPQLKGQQSLVRRGYQSESPRPTPASAGKANDAWTKVLPGYKKIDPPFEGRPPASPVSAPQPEPQSEQPVVLWRVAQKNPKASEERRNTDVLRETDSILSDTQSLNQRGAGIGAEVETEAVSGSGESAAAAAAGRATAAGQEDATGAGGEGATAAGGEFGSFVPPNCDLRTTLLKEQASRPLSADRGSDLGANSGESSACRHPLHSAERSEPCLGGATKRLDSLESISAERSTPCMGLPRKISTGQPPVAKPAPLAGRSVAPAASQTTYAMLSVRRHSPLFQATPPAGDGSISPFKSSPANLPVQCGTTHPPDSSLPSPMHKAVSILVAASTVATGVRSMPTSRISRSPTPLERRIQKVPLSQDSLSSGKASDSSPARCSEACTPRRPLHIAIPSGNCSASSTESEVQSELEALAGVQISPKKTTKGSGISPSRHTTMPILRLHEMISPRIKTSSGSRASTSPQTPREASSQRLSNSEGSSARASEAHSPSTLPGEQGFVRSPTQPASSHFKRSPTMESSGTALLSGSSLSRLQSVGEGVASSEAVSPGASYGMFSKSQNNMIYNAGSCDEDSARPLPSSFQGRHVKDLCLARPSTARAQLESANKSNSPSGSHNTPMPFHSPRMAKSGDEPAFHKVGSSDALVCLTSRGRPKSVIPGHKMDPKVASALAAVKGKLAAEAMSKPKYDSDGSEDKSTPSLLGRDDFIRFKKGFHIRDKKLFATADGTWHVC